MKHIYLIGGPMGVGKTAVCRNLQQRLPNCVFLDGDWCWDMRPFRVTEETRAMVLDNICYLLNRFLACSAYENVLFCWVLHQQAVIDEILARIHTDGCAVTAISLVCDADTLVQRLQGDVAAGLRTRDVIARSLERLPFYESLDTEKLDVTDLTAAQAAERILASGASQKGRRGERLP